MPSKRRGVMKKLAMCWLGVGDTAADRLQADDLWVSLSVAMRTCPPPPPSLGTRFTASRAHGSRPLARRPPQLVPSSVRSNTHCSGT